MGDWIVNEGPKWVFLFLWLGTNIGLFIGFFFVYSSPTFFYYSAMTGYPLQFARASAACLNFNCLLILLPVCRNLISFLRGSLRRCCRRNVTRQLDKNITFHKACAYVICFWTAIHYYAHTFNVERLIEAHNSPNNKTRGLLSTLSNLKDDSFINPVRTPTSNPMYVVVTEVAGYTGLIITLALIVIVSSATEVIRRSYFEVFWYTHHIFIIFFIGLVTHGLGGFVRGQTNLDVHDPEFCQDKYQEWGRIPECPLPTFAGGGAQTWKWVIAPMILYFVERCIRFFRGQQQVVISKVVKHPSKVIELQMKKKGFKMQAGEYIFLACPSVSRLEWHPFTLTSSGQEDYFSVHIRIVGDWTSGLAKVLNADDQEFQESYVLPSVQVDGPFGTASEDIYRYQVDICVAAGIGVTPFAAILKDIWYRYCDPSHEMKLRKVYFYWICPDTNAFEWFADLLKILEDQMVEAGKADLLDYNIYLSRGWDANQALHIATHEDDEVDPVTGLKQKTYYGRPNWDQVFSSVAEEFPETSVGVFFCGPKVLSSTLHKMSNKHSSANPNGTHFFYNKENF